MSEPSEMPLGEVLVATREDLRPHAERGGLILVDPALDLALVSHAVSSDLSASVEAWVSMGQLTRPLFEELPQSAYRMIIVQPFVLVQLT